MRWRAPSDIAAAWEFRSSALGSGRAGRQLLVNGSNGRKACYRRLMRDADLKDFSAFLREFQSETDRGAALVGAALIDQKLADTLRSFFAAGKTAGELLDGGTAPLGTFSARIKAAYALGLIDDFELTECDLIRKVRNEFAHSIHGTTFAEPKIMALCDRLQSDQPDGRQTFKDNRRGVFINAVILTVMCLTYRAEWVAKEKRATKSWP
jgi:mannitol operon repressor